MDWLIEFDKYITLAINNTYSPLFDSVMVFVSKIAVWIPLYLAVLVAIIYRYKKDWKKILLIIAALVLTVVLTDQISCLIKDSVCRLRPCHDESIADSVRVIVSKGGLYGFVSSHAANVFGFALLTSMIFRKHWYTILIFVWATIISFSRIYLAKHFLGDVLCGALVGVSIALIMKLLLNQIERKTISR